MEMKIIVPDSELDGFARRTGWRELVQGPLGQQVPNPIDQATHAFNKVKAYIENEIIAGAVDNFEQQRQAVIDTKKEMLGSVGGGISAPPVRS